MVHVQGTTCGDGGCRGAHASRRLVPPTDRPAATLRPHAAIQGPQLDMIHSVVGGAIWAPLLLQSHDPRPAALCVAPPRRGVGDACVHQRAALSRCGYVECSRRSVCVSERVVVGAGVSHGHGGVSRAVAAGGLWASRPPRLGTHLQRPGSAGALTEPHRSTPSSRLSAWIARPTSSFARELEFLHDSSRFCSSFDSRASSLSA